MVPAPPLPDLKCTDNLYSEPTRFAKALGTKYAIECPPACFSETDPKKVQVWGNPIIGYTDDSMICMAAMHAGLLTDGHKTELTIKFNQDPKEYLCGNTENQCNVNGIKSLTRDYAEKGFTFEDTNNACKFFRSKYTGTPITVDYVE
jgi:hypothetical protein